MMRKAFVALAVLGLLLGAAGVAGAASADLTQSQSTTISDITTSCEYDCLDDGGGGGGGDDGGGGGCSGCGFEKN